LCKHSSESRAPPCGVRRSPFLHFACLSRNPHLYHLVGRLSRIYGDSGQEDLHPNPRLLTT